MAEAKNNRIGILGGTFNPVHLGHLALARGAVKAFGLEKVLFIPSAKPPHKKPGALAPVKHRMAMLKLAIKGKPGFEISDIETRRAGPSYTIDTITRLKKKNPSADYYFIIGSDSLRELHTWKRIRDLLKLCTFITFTRPGKGGPGRIKNTRLGPARTCELMRHFMPGRMPDISSSAIRRRIAEGKNIRYLVPQAVAEYIAAKALYKKNKEKNHKNI